MNGFFCQKCGAPGHENDIFCRKCGAKHKSDAKKQDGSPDGQAKFCANCGNSMRQGANFCDNCGSENGRYAGANKPAGTEKRGTGSRRGRAFALLFLLVLAAAGFAAYKYYSGDIDLAKIIAALKRETRDEREPSGDAAASGGAISLDERGQNQPEDRRNVSEQDESPETDIIIIEIQPETAGPQPSADIAPVSGEERSPYSDAAAPVSEEPVPPAIKSETDDPDNPEYVWTERDAGGYSALAAPDRFFTSAQTPSAVGVVSGDRVRLRSDHNLKGRIVGQFDTGASFDVVRRYSSGDEKYCWYEARRDGAEGWIYGEFFNISGVRDDSPANTSDNVRLIITSPEPYVSSDELSP
jgi:hypothetical protein